MNEVREWASTTLGSVRREVAEEATRLGSAGVDVEALREVGLAAMGQPVPGVGQSLWAGRARASAFKVMRAEVAQALNAAVCRAIDATILNHQELGQERVARVVANAIVAELGRTPRAGRLTTDAVVSGASVRAVGELLREAFAAGSPTAREALAAQAAPSVDAELTRIEEAVQIEIDQHTPPDFAFDQRHDRAVDFAERAVRRAMTDYRGAADGSFAEFAIGHARDAILYCFAHRQEAEAGCAVAIAELEGLYEHIPFVAARAFRTASDFGTRVDNTAEDLLSPEWTGCVAAAYLEMQEAIRNRGQFDPAQGTLADYLYKSARNGAARAALSGLARQSPTYHNILKVFECCGADLRHQLGREVDDGDVLAAGEFTDWIRQVLVGETVEREAKQAKVPLDEITLSGDQLREIGERAPVEARKRLAHARVMYANADSGVSTGSPDKSDQEQSTVDPADPDPRWLKDPFVRRRVDEAIAQLDMESAFIVRASVDDEFDNQSLWVMLNVGRALAFEMAQARNGATSSGVPVILVAEADLRAGLTAGYAVVRIIAAHTCRALKKRFDSAHPKGGLTATVLAELRATLGDALRVSFEARLTKDRARAAARGTPEATLEGDVTTTLNEGNIKKKKSLAFDKLSCVLSPEDTGA